MLNKQKSTSAWALGKGQGWMLALAATLWLSACQPSGAPVSAASAGLAVTEAASAPASDAAINNPSEAASASAPQAAVVAVRGIYTWGNEVETLSPCNSDKTYWLEGSEALLAPLQELALKKADAANEAYQPIYVEVQVRHAGRATDGFAVDYDGVMQLQAVQSASDRVPADCPLLDVPASSATPASQ